MRKFFRPGTLLSRIEEFDAFGGVFAGFLGGEMLGEKAYRFSGKLMPAQR
jgi:hypothetical protein